MEKLKKFEREIICAFVLGLVVFSLVAFWANFRKTLSEILAFSWTLVPLILSFSLLNYLLRFLRWHLFLRKIGFKNRLSLSQSALVFFAGLPLTLTPGKTGEILKAYFLKKITQDHLSRTIPVVITERLTDGLAALVLLLFSLGFYPLGWLPFLIAAATCILFISLLYYQPFWSWLSQKLSLLGQKKSFFLQIEKKLFHFRYVLLELVSWKLLLLAILLAATAWFLEALGLSLIISNLGHLPLSSTIILKSVFIFCFVSILGFLSFLPGGLGITEGSTAGLVILLFNLSKPKAAAIALLLRLFTLWWGVALGLIAFSLMIKAPRANSPRILTSSYKHSFGRKPKISPKGRNFDPKAD